MSYNPKADINKKVELSLQIAQLKGVKERDFTAHIRVNCYMNKTVHELKNIVNKLKGTEEKLFKL